MISYTPRTIVNGSLLRDFVDQHVSIHVNVEQEVDRYATTINAKTTDDIDVQIQLNEPLSNPIKGWIEVIGVPSTATSIRNKEIIIFPNEDDEQAFDKTAYNALVTFLNNCKDIFAE